jgi:hypothetical protein
MSVLDGGDSSVDVNVPRRSSGFVHEIQPPKRRLSSHQMLLLTPFGGMLPSGALGGQGQGMSRGDGSLGMTRGNSSMGMGMDMRAGSSSMGMRMGRTESTIMGRTSPALGITSPAPLPIPRKRHHSLSQRLSTSSPLASAPMTTIPSGSGSGSGSGVGSGSGSGGTRSREGIDVGEGMERLEDGGSVVHMMRSNSLPVLTLRELDALKEKDGELGIARGGGWAWVSREEDVIEDDLEE